MMVSATGLTDVLGGVGGAATGASGFGTSGGQTVPFGGMLRSMVEQTGALETKASEAVTGLLSGQGVEVHDAMIATQKADVAFQMALQVRNKSVSAYQSMMAMQF
jgi:flagellar hook-basal body complex protein FliE